MRDKLRETVEAYRMFSPNETVVVGVSGGADSMALLHALKTVYPQLTLIAAHLNHQLRGVNAQADEDFVRSWCEAHRIRCEVLRVPIRELAQKRGIGEELCGRQERYRFFEALADAENAKIATAHTLSDTAETVLFHLARGTSGRGLCGIPPVRGRIIRPLIFCTRAETELYCVEQHIRYRTDESNADVHYARNRIRQEVVPSLLKINPAFPEAIHRMTQNLSAQEQYLDVQAAHLLTDAATSRGYEASVLQKAPEFLAVRALLHQAERIGARDSDFATAERLARLIRQEGAVPLHGLVTVQHRNGYISIVKQEPEKEIVPRTVCVPETVQIAGRTLKFRLLAGKFFWSSEKIYKKFLSRALDYGTISAQLILRTRAEGDLFSPKGRGLTKKVRKLFNEAHIPAEKRAKVLLLESAGRICWIEGFGASEWAKPTVQSDQILIITEENADERSTY